MPRRPLISVILPVYNIEEELLRKCIDSVRRQTYENWQLCIADDFSPSPHVRRVIEEYASRD
ncbi:glycosyltransferase, partial [Escherichia coli]|nr:glycosyltransferase [Escherichia coli]